MRKIVDAHMHLWDRANGYDWLDETIFKGRFPGNFLLSDYLKMVGESIIKAVHMECHGFPHDPVLETKWVQEIADKEGWPHAIVGFAPLHDSNISTILKRHRHYPLMRGIRMNLRAGPKGFFLANRNDYMRDLNWQRGFSELSKHSLSFDMQIYPEQIDDAIALLRVYDDIPVIMDHLALPAEPSEKNLPFWAERLQELAQIPTVFMKLSGIGVFFQGITQRTLIEKYIRKALQIFGPKRCLFAGNIPVDPLFIPFHTLMAVYENVAKDYSKEEQHQIFYETAKRVYRL